VLSARGRGWSRVASVGSEEAGREWGEGRRAGDARNGELLGLKARLETEGGVTPHTLGAAVETAPPRTYKGQEGQ
jgi:hypothetical protein